MLKQKRKNKAHRRTRRASRTGPSHPWLKQGIIVAAVVVALGGALFLTRPAAHSADAAIVQATEPALGSATAPITILEYGDFGCPACQAWHRAGIKEQVLAHYGDQVRFVWRDFPVITPMSPKAAEAGQCAHDQGRFWEYHDLLFARAPAIGENDLKAYATELGLNTARFEQCLASGQHSGTVRSDYNAARAASVRGTPSFVVNGVLLPAPPSFAFLQQVIESELSSR